MQWTPQQVEQIPEPYRDFMLILKAIPDSRDEVIPLTGVRLGKIYHIFATKYDYDFRHIRELADRLKENGLVAEDEHGFLRPTSEGEALIRILAVAHEPEEVVVPEFPKF